MPWQIPHLCFDVDWWRCLVNIDGCFEFVLGGVKDESPRPFHESSGGLVIDGGGGDPFVEVLVHLFRVLGNLGFVDDELGATQVVDSPVPEILHGTYIRRQESLKIPFHFFPNIVANGGTQHVVKVEIPSGVTLVCEHEIGEVPTVMPRLLLVVQEYGKRGKTVVFVDDVTEVCGRFFALVDADVVGVVRTRVFPVLIDEGWVSTLRERTSP